MSTAAKSPITTHVLDTAGGRPAAGIAVRLEAAAADGRFRRVGEGRTDNDGRVTDLLPPGTVEPGLYRLVFAVGDHLRATAGGGFYEEVPIVFRVDDPEQHYHVPLLLNPYGYSTYRGS